MITELGQDSWNSWAGMGWNSWAGMVGMAGMDELKTTNQRAVENELLET